MAKRCLAMAAALLTLLLFIPKANAETAGTAKGYVLVEVNTGEVISEANSGVRVHAAGVTKLMSHLIFFEALKTGTVTLGDEVRVSSEAAGKGGTSAFLDAGETQSFEALLQAAIVCSANDATVALAEHVAGSEAAFVEKMNTRAAQLGVEAVFADATGLSSETKLTALEISKIAAELSKYSGFFKYSSIWMYTLVHNSGRETTITNANVLVNDGSGVDGMSTGSTGEAGYSLAATVKSGPARFICVVLGDVNSKSRFSFAKEMLLTAAATYGVKEVARKGEKYKAESVEGGVESEVDLYAKEDLCVLYKKGEESSVEIITEIEKLVAPIEKGRIVGKVIVNTPLGRMSVALAVGDDVRKQSFSTDLSRILEIWLFGK